MNPATHFMINFEITFVLVLYVMAIIGAICSCIYWSLKEPTDLTMPLL